PMFPRNMSTSLRNIGFMAIQRGRLRAWVEQLTWCQVGDRTSGIPPTPAQRRERTNRMQSNGIGMKRAVRGLIRRLRAGALLRAAAGVAALLVVTGGSGGSAQPLQSAGLTVHLSPG